MRPHSTVRRATFAAEAMPHLRALFNFAATLAGASDAEDLVQVTCVRALEHLDAYQPGTNVRAWLFTILRNECVSRLRREQRRAAVESYGGDDVLGDRPDETVDLETLLMQHRWSAEIKAALLALPESYRLPVYLKDVEGFSYREIAAIVDCPLGTVMSRLARGRAALRAALVAQARERGLLRATPRAEGNHGL